MAKEEDNTTRIVFSPGFVDQNITFISCSRQTNKLRIGHANDLHELSS